MDANGDRHEPNICRHVRCRTSSDTCAACDNNEAVDDAERFAVGLLHAQSNNAATHVTVTTKHCSDMELHVFHGLRVFQKKHAESRVGFSNMLKAAL